MNTVGIKIVEEQRWKDLAEVGNTPAGARVLRWIIYVLGRLEEPSFSTDALTMAMLEGKRLLAREVSNELRKIDDAVGSELSLKVIEARLTRVPAPTEKKE